MKLILKRKLSLSGGAAKSGGVFLWHQAIGVNGISQRRVLEA